MLVKIWTNGIIWVHIILSLFQKEKENDKKEIGSKIVGLDF